MTDRNLILLNKLIKAYSEHGNIVIGVDFDDTIFPYTQYGDTVANAASSERAKRVRDLLIDLKPYSIQCLWTVANEWSLIYKKFICQNYYKMYFDYYNESPITPDPTVRKPHFNVLLDDCAGLDSVIETLREFLKYVKQDESR